MKFTCSTSINKPIKEVAEAFLDPECMKQSHQGFIGKELITGNPNEVGSKYKLIYKKFEMQETITANNLPHSFSGLYEHKHMTNTMTSKFESINDNKTKFLSEIEYTKLNGFAIKVMAKLFPGMFKKQGDKWLQRFKTYVENN